MTHFTTEEWVNFVNQVVSASKRQAMEAHLSQGCKRCMQTVSLWQHVQQAASAEASYQPPESAVRIAKAAFGSSELARGKRKSSSVVEVLFDSFLQPLVAGARSAGSENRQMLYRADPYEVHVNIEGKPEGSRVIITGQLQNYRDPKASCSQVPVMISNLRGHVVQTLTNQSGEFCEEMKYSGDLELKFPGAKGGAVIISVRDALGKSANGSY